MGQTREVIAKVGKEFNIDLLSNRTTGHRWKAEYDPALLQLANINYEPNSDKIGAGGTESFRFKSLKKGKTLIKMIYGRPWERMPAEEAAYIVIINNGDKQSE